jgi:excisionase family DNA binding protein
MTSNPTTHPSVGFELSPDQLLFTTDEAAHVLSVGRTTIYLLMRAGELKPVHIGRSCRISRGELERYVARIDAADKPNRLRRRIEPALGDPPPDVA